jgi:hypothetical protein
MAEMSMRNIELPALRSDPYAPENIGIADAEGYVPIPADMNKPILFFKQGNQTSTTATATGTSGAFTITLTSTPNPTVAVGMAVTGTGIGTNANVTVIVGSLVTLSVANSGTVSGTITFGNVATQSSETGPWIVYDRIGDRDIITQGMIAQLYLSPVNVPAVIRGKFSEVGQYYHFLPWIGEGAQINMYYYKAWPLLFSPITNGGAPVDVQNNAVLQTWPEGYVYATLHEYYVKRHNSEDAAIYKAKFDAATATVEDGVVTGISIVNAGQGYQAAPLIEIVGEGAGATAVATLNPGSAGTVANVTVTTGGSGYLPIQFEGSTAATVVLSNGLVENIQYR